MTIKVTYNVTDVYMSQSVSPVYINVSYSDGGTSGGGVWGTITGTLSNQTDLQTALNAKLDESTIDGGIEGQILSKASGTDFDFAWINNYAKYLATNVRNQTGSTIAAFQVVYISGATGNKPLISLADADTEATSSKTYGVTATSIANNGTGDVVTAGELSGINTSAFNEGDLLWLSTTAGGVVTTPPAEPAHAVFIGYVVRSHPTLGTIDVSIQNGYELNELHGVQITTPTDNQGLFYNATSTLWENKSITTALGYTPVPTTRNITINGVTYDLSADRSYTVAAGISGSGASGQVTYWTGASAVSGSNNFTWDNAVGLLTVKSENSAAPVRGILNEQYNNGVQAAAMVFRKARGTIASPANVLASDLVGAFSFSARVGGAFTSDRALFGANMATSTGIGMYFIAGSTDGDYAPDLYIHPTGNVVVNGGGTIITGGVTDGGQKLQVYGDTLLRGSGNTNTTTALTVQNSDSTNLFRVRNEGRVFLGSSSTSIYPMDKATTSISLSGNGLSFFDTSTGSGDTFYYTGSDYVHTSGVARLFNATRLFWPTSGTGSLVMFNISPNINQTGGANGITRGLYVNPTLTAAADFRAIETTAGNVLFGSNFFWDNTNGRLGIGTNAPSTTLDIRGKTRIQVSSNCEFDFVDSTNSLRIGLGSGGGFIGTLTTAALIFLTGALERGRFTTNGNLMLGTTSDLGVRLGVVGDTLLRGSGNTSATTALTVQNSSSTNLLNILNDGKVGIGTNAPSSLVHAFASSGAATSGFMAQNNGTGASDLAAYSLQNQTQLSRIFLTTAAYTNVPMIGANGLAIYANGASGITFWNDNASGSIKFGVGSATAAGSQKVTIKAGGQVRFHPLSSAPASPEAGDVYYDSTLNKLRVYTTAWETITSI